MVEWKKLGEVCTFNRGRTITAKDAVQGSIPVIAGGQTPSYYHNEPNRTGESITVAGSGAYAGFVSYWNTPIFVSDAFTVDPSNFLLHKYVFQWLKMNQQKIFETQKGAGVPHVHGKDIAGFLIPIPSLSEQERIVGILDTFTASIDNLKEQIAQRRKQYEYYRDQLLDLEGKPGVEWKKLGEVCTFNRGRTITAKDAVQGSIPVIAGGQTPSYYHNEPNRTGESITVAGSGAYAGFVSYWNTPIFVSDAFTVDPSNFLLHKYVFQWLKMNQQKIFETQKGAGVPHVHGKDIAGFLIPIPSLSEQQRIVEVLDTFEASIRNLEAQLEQRQKQYEHYRNELLTFE